MSEMKRPLKVFLYHAPSDKEAVRDLYLRLMKDGVDAWLVKERILPSQDWKHEIHQAVREADVVVVCLSEHFHQEGFRKKQARTAFDTVIEQLQKEISLIAVRLEECDRLETLGTWQGVDLFEEAGYELLMHALQVRAERIGTSIQKREGSLPPVATSSPTPEESLPEKDSVAAMQGTHGILIEGSAVKIRSSPSQRRLGRAIFVGLAGLLLVAVLGSGSPQLDRWYKLSLMVLNETPIPTPSVTTVPPKPNAKAIPGNIIFLIDTSESMSGKINLIKTAVSDFISRLDRRYPVSIMTYNAHIESEIGLTLNHAGARQALRSIDIEVEHDYACVNDALYAAIQETSLTPLGKDARSVIILLTDVGMYSNSESGTCRVPSPSEVMQMAAKYPVSIYDIHIGDRVDGNSYLAGLTGGASFEARDEKKIERALRSLANQKFGLSTEFITPVPPPIQTTGARNETMVFVPAGEFIMGDNNKVYLDDFWIDKTEVTNAMYAKCEQGGMCKAPRSYNSNTNTHYYGDSTFDDYPVIFVSWTDADKYCVWAGGRLPTEAEWEKAARGTEGRQFPWGNDDPSGPIGFLNYRGQDTMVAGSYPNGASPYGALDMAGNVGEWVWDWFSIDYYNHPPASNPSGPATGEYRVWRGGSWANTSLDWIRTYSRTGNLPTDYSSGLGFRCARDAAP